MNKYSALTWIAASALLVVAVQTSADDTPASPITVFVAKKIHTMDPAWPDATAVSMQDGKILEVGSLEEIKIYLGKKAYKLDHTFKDRVLMPGFIEAHGHPIIGGLLLNLPLLSYLPTARAYEPDFPGLKSMEAVTSKLKKYLAAEKNPKQPVLAWGFDVIAMGRHLDKDFLNGISMSQPLMVWDASEHFVYANNPAMKTARITKESTKIHGVMAGKDGEPNGQFFGTAAIQYLLLRSGLQSLDPAIALKQMKYMADFSRKNGITTTSELPSA